MRSVGRAVVNDPVPSLQKSSEKLDLTFVSQGEEDRGLARRANAQAVREFHLPAFHPCLREAKGKVELLR
jgi:hypothetical protein